MNVASTFLIGILCFLFGAVASQLPLSKVRNFSYLFSLAGALLFLAAGGYLLFTPAFTSADIAVSPIFSFTFYADALSAFFVVLISFITISVSLYSIGFTRGIKNAGFMGFLYNILILSMYGVVLSANIYSFLVSWETMAVASYFLVVFERNEETAKAGLFTVVMTHIGTAFIIGLFLVLAHYTGSMDFVSMRAAAAGLPQGVKSLVFIFAVIGFGTKAGIIPLHTWIPRAYPVAPSNITPLMSGVMIKTAVYGFLRIVLDVLGTGPEWWGIAVIAVGAVSAVLGILYAIMENDLKVFLAYSSVENVGIILLGIGASMMFRSSGMLVLSGFALAAALYHALNHALFKGLLFLGAGSVVNATQTRNMEKLGGLLKVMPYTGFFFLLPPASLTKMKAAMKIITMATASAVVESDAEAPGVIKTPCWSSSTYEPVMVKTAGARRATGIPGKTPKSIQKNARRAIPRTIEAEDSFAVVTCPLRAMPRNVAPNVLTNPAATIAPVSARAAPPRGETTCATTEGDR